MLKIFLSHQMSVEGNFLHLLVLLKQGSFFIVESRYEDIYTVAKERDAGICGIFCTRAEAEEFIANAYTPAAPVRPFNRPGFP